MSLLKITPGRLKITVYQNDSINEVLTFNTKSTSNGVVTKTPVNITSWAFGAQAFDNTGCITTGNCTVLDGANGTLQVAYPSNLTATPTGSGHCLNHEIYVITGQNRRTYVAGPVEVQSRNGCCDACTD